MGADASTADLFLAVESRRSGKIKGESTTDDHEDDIILSGWSWGAQAGDAMGSSTRTGRRQYGPLVVTKGMDAASLVLLAALARNDEITEATLTMRKSGGEALDYFKLKLEGARVADISYAVDDLGHTVEQVTLTFTSFDAEYSDQRSDGTGGGAIAFSDEVLSPNA
ncbi:type VI secretion system tube protein Hcp [Paucibacter sp. R3-3]|uniref:Type VI secretion system tube protein Hcp n=1 Tax=Roseateles agri TaxID=3098619 RepID=A0ABU5DBZ4_9BURK|nr:type VI secretion system tube protein Hcp [Paucibacter sp. R3-3]MDY0743280.1 type VI secretion system tube protein Hcp [Paucibacter sp. R3-3]